MSTKLALLVYFLSPILFGATTLALSKMRLNLIDVVKVNFGDFNVSSTCRQELKLFVSNLEELKKDTLWAWKMIDANSKMQSGILEGNFADLGHFDECILIDGPQNIKGKYCLATIKVGLTNNGVFTNESRLGDSTGRIPDAQWAACFPSACSGAEIQKIYNSIAKEHIPDSVTIDFSFEEKLCQTSKDVYPELDLAAIITIAIFLTIVLFMTISTIYDFYLKHTKREPPHLVFLAFSIKENGRKLFKIATTPDQFHCMNGLRVISMMWIILGHQYSNIRTVAITNGLDLLEWGNSLHSMLLLGASVSVDTFFLMSGALMVYGFLKAMHQNVPFNVPKYWLHRFLRLTPALAAIVLVTATLMKYVVNGPKWPEEHIVPNRCVQNWWSTLLYLQNYVNVEEMCLIHSWYLAVDMQLFLLSPLILVPLWKSKKRGLILVYFLTVVSMVVPFTIAWVYDLKFTILEADTDDYSYKYYFITHTRTTPWFIGVILGYYLYQIRMSKKKIVLNRFFVVFMWIASVAVLVACVFGGHDIMTDERYQKWAQVCYLTFVRPAWAVALCWIIVACTIGYGGPIDWFLSFPVYQIFGRFTYSLYLLHPFIITTRFMSSRVPMHFSDFEMMYTFWGTLFFTAAASLFWILAFESPMIVIEKALFRNNTKSSKGKLEEVSVKNQS